MSAENLNRGLAFTYFMIGCAMMYILELDRKMLVFFAVPAILTVVFAQLFEVNKHINQDQIWLTPFWDRVMAVVSIICYGLAFVLVFIGPYPNVAFQLISIVITIAISLFLDSKLGLNRNILSQDSQKHKKHVPKAQYLKIRYLVITVMVVSVVTILISGFYRWTVILGLAFTMLFIGVIVFIIFNDHYEHEDFI